MLTTADHDQVNDTPDPADLLMAGQGRDPEDTGPRADLLMVAVAGMVAVLLLAWVLP